MLLNNSLDVTDLTMQVALQLLNLLCLSRELVLSRRQLGMQLLEELVGGLRGQDACYFLFEGDWFGHLTIQLVIIISEMVIGSMIFEELKVSNSCYMAAAIQFNYAMFHIFSGPLFANLQTYAFLDLLIWGVSPILFELCRGPLKRRIQPTLISPIQDYGRWLVRRRFIWIFLCFVAIVVSFLFMNYSASFRWNYFSRCVNLDFGYLLFDLSCRCMELIVEVEEEEQQQLLIDSGRDSMEPLYHRAGYCKYRNLFTLASYFMVFYLSTLYDTNDSATGQQIFTSLSILCCLFTLTIPFLYLFKHRTEHYNSLQQNEATRQVQRVEPLEQEQEGQREGEGTPETDRRVYAIFVLVSFSFFVNTSYFSLWVMEGLAGENQSAYKQFNQTLFVSAIFFLSASFILFVVAHIYIGCMVREGQTEEVRGLVASIKPFLICYGLLMVAVFLHGKSEWHLMVIPILPFGFLGLVVNIYSQKIDEWKQQDRLRLGTHRLNFLTETMAYLVVPIVLTMLGLGGSAIHLFGWLSAASLIAAGLLIPSKH